VYWLTDDGIGRGYLDGFAGGGKRSRALLLVKGWVAKGSKEPRVLDWAIAGVEEEVGLCVEGRMARTKCSCPPFIGERKRPKKTPAWMGPHKRSIVPAQGDPRRAKPEQRAWHRKQGKIRSQSGSSLLTLGESVTWALVPLVIPSVRFHFKAQKPPVRAKPWCLINLRGGARNPAKRRAMLATGKSPPPTEIGWRTGSVHTGDRCLSTCDMAVFANISLALRCGVRRLKAT